MDENVKETVEQEVKETAAEPVKEEVKEPEVIPSMDDFKEEIEQSLKKHTDEDFWDDFRDAMEEGKIFTVNVAEAVPAGVITYLNEIRAFIPASQLAVKYVENTADFVGKDLDVKIITADPEKNKLVLSAKEVERERLAEEKKKKMSSVEAGQIVEGTVDKITTYGAFVTLDEGISGLLHISQISHKRIGSPREVIKEGETVKVKILAVENGKISLSMKALTEPAEPSEDPDAAPVEYKDEGTVSTGLAGILAGLKIDN
jgi:small subunit ribosomal protein S1